MNIYYDRFASNYVTETDWYAAPERYYKILGNEKDNKCIEQWFMNNGDVVEIEYNALAKNPSEEEVDHIYALRKEIEIAHKSKLSYMIAYVIPKENYMEIEKWLMDDDEM